MAGWGEERIKMLLIKEAGFLGRVWEGTRALKMKVRV